MVKLKEVPFQDKRRKSITVKGTKLTDRNVSFEPVVNPTFEKGGIVHKGQGAVMKIKTTKYC